MADCKARSFTFKTPPGTNLGTLKEAIESENDNEIKVFQEIGANEYLIELTSANQTQYLIENGFDAGQAHIRCHPLHGYYLNMSIMGLKAYVSDDEVVEKLLQYGKIKGQVIRLKYKHDHELSGLENGNRLIRMVLTSPSIPYSLNIGSEWCRVIHNHQLLICSNCNEAGHSRKNCPQIQCRNCNQLGHISYHCLLPATLHTATTNDENITMENNTPERNATEDDNSDMTMDELAEQNDIPDEEQHDMPDKEQASSSTNEKSIITQNVETSHATGSKPVDHSPGKTPNQGSDRQHDMEQAITSDIIPTNNNEEHNMDISLNTKRPHQTDSDLDPAPLPRRQRIKPVPNLNAARNHNNKKKKDKNNKQ